MTWNKKRQCHEIRDEDFSDRTDADLRTSVLEYEFARNPKTNEVVVSRLKLDAPYDSDDENDYHWDFTTIDKEDVQEALREMPDSFWSYIGNDIGDYEKETYIRGLDNEYLSMAISDIQSYCGLFFETCTFAEVVVKLID